MQRATRKTVHGNLFRTSHSGVHFGKFVEVFTTPLEHWCLVHHPRDVMLTANWKMSNRITALQAASLAALQTEDKDYDRGWSDTRSEA